MHHVLIIVVVEQTQSELEKKPWLHILGLLCAAFNKESTSKCFLLFHR